MRLPARVRLAGLGLAALAGCGLSPESVTHDDPRVIELLAAAQEVDRAALGFTPIDREATLRLEDEPRAGYDAMLHVDGRTNRTLAFRRRGGRCEWIGEQEIFRGPAEYVDPDGRLREEIVITYERERLTGVPLNTIHVAYKGEDARLASGETLTLADVEPVLTTWGFTR
jgi:hypothetical protein